MAKYTGNDFREDGMPSGARAGDARSFRASYVFASAVTLATGDMVELGKVPPGHVIADMALDADALGTGAVVSAGVLNAGSTDLAATGISNANAAAGGYARQNATSAMRVPVSETASLPVGLKVTTGASAALSAGAKVGLTVWYRPKQSGE